MQLLEKVRETEFLGSEFLVWMWFRTETGRGFFELGDKGTAEIWFDGKITLQSETERGVETIACSGETPNMKEARFALAEDKKVTQAAIKLDIGDNQWSFVLDSTWMNFKTFKAPKVIQDRKEDPDGVFYEKMFLIEEAVSAMNKIYESFIKLRVSPEWESEERPALVKWVSQGRE
jgi:recombination associated protein RdgC